MLPSKFTVAVQLFLSFWVVCCAASLQWVRLTNDNFSADIHTHPYLLCLATVPWCGESRSVMRSLSKSIEADEEMCSAIQLRVVYVNLDKILDSQILRITKYPALTFFRHSTPYQYKGKLKAQNILAAIHHGLTFNSKDLPFKKLETASELSILLESTDKAVVLFDFCNYFDKFHGNKQHQLLDEPVDTRQSTNMGTITEEMGIESSYCQRLEVVEQCSADMSFRSIDGRSGALKTEKGATEASDGQVLQEDDEVNLWPADTRKDEPKTSADKNTPTGSLNLYDTPLNKNGVKHPFVDCHFQTNILSAKSLPSFPWMAFPSSFRSTRFSQSLGCNRTTYKDFGKVYRNLTELVRSYALTPEHASFALVKNRSLLADLGIDHMQNNSWFLMQWIPDQPHLPRLYLGNEMLESFLESMEPLVPELNRYAMNQLSAFTDNSLAVILFVDRVSSISEVRRKSREALTALRAIARDYVGGESREMGVSTTRVDRRKESKPIKEDEATPIRLGMHTASLPSLKNLLGQGTVQLLKDQPIMVQKEITGEDESLHSEAATQGSHVVLKFLVEDGNKLHPMGSSQSIISDKLEDLDYSKVLLSEDNAIFKVHEGKIVGISDTDHIMNLQSLVTTSTGSSTGLENFQSKQDIDMSVMDNEDVEMAAEKNTTAIEKNGLSFYFADGEDQLKDLILPGLPYPSLVILDSANGGQYVFPTNNQSINYLSLKAFMDQLSKGNLQKTYTSEFAHQKPRQQVQPPFVNRDFHEINGVPYVTTENLLQIISGLWMPDSSPKLSLHCAEKLGSSQKSYSLVLFTTPSCGFCKRMELAFREVHQLLTVKLGELGSSGFCKQMAKGFNSGEEMTKDQEWPLFEGVCTSSQALKFKENLPHLLQIDCTANDCRTFFNSLNQKEVYPSIILYRSGNKAPPVVFEGGSKVREILNFIAAEEKTCAKVLHVLQGESKRNGVNSTFMGCHLPPTPIKSIFLDSGSSRRAFRFNADAGKMPPSSSAEVGDGQDQNDVKPIVYPTIGSVLLATAQLSEASKAFESSKILIVKADGQEGFHGLILNKPLEWKALPEGLVGGAEVFVNRTLLWYGGPVLAPGQPFSSLSRLRDVEGFSEVVPGVYFGGLSATSQVLGSIKEGKLEATDFWFFLGQTVWGWQQLLNEMAHNLWNLTSYEEGGAQLAHLKEWLDGSRMMAAIDAIHLREDE